MLSVTAIFRAAPGREQALREALLAVAAYVRASEPGTAAYYVSQDAKNPGVLATYERYADRAALDAHESSRVVAAFFDTVRPLLDGDVALFVGEELSSSESGARGADEAALSAEDLNAANDE